MSEPRYVLLWEGELLATKSGIQIFIQDGDFFPSKYDERLMIKPVRISISHVPFNCAVRIFYDTHGHCFVSEGFFSNGGIIQFQFYYSGRGDDANYHSDALIIREDLFIPNSEYLTLDQVRHKPMKLEFDLDDIELAVMEMEDINEHR